MGPISNVDSVELQTMAAEMGMPDLGMAAWEEMAESTRLRISDMAAENGPDAMRLGALSYLVEILGLLRERAEHPENLAVAVAKRFLEHNPGLASDLSDVDLAHFARRIIEGRYNWESLRIAYLDPEAARLERLRENLRLSPEERWRRQRLIISQLKRARRA